MIDKNRKKLRDKIEANPEIQQNLDDIIIDRFTRMACETNNGGIPCQIEWLIEVEQETVKSIEAMLFNKE